MIERIFDPLALLVIVGSGLLGAVVGTIVAGIRGVPATLAIEVGLLTLLGAFLARTFISVLLDLGGNTAGAGLLVGWGFFLWPGAIDTVAGLFGRQFLTTPDILLWLAVGVGGFCGLLDGVHQVRSRDVGGVVSFVVDNTWGLGGTTNAGLLHIVDTFAGTHQADGRRNVHRYDGGFRIKAIYAFTQGPVMSELSSGPGTALYAHEGTHTMQNRIFGPFYPLSYVGWMVVMFIPSLIAAAVRRAGVGETIEAWCYFNNPWETWGYKVGENNGAGPRTGFGTMVWSDLLVVVIAALYFVGVIALTAFLISTVFL